MPKLPGQRGFYDDVRPFQRRDVKVRTDAFAPTRAEQRRRQVVWGLLVLIFLGATLWLRLRSAETEARSTYHVPGYWHGVAGGVSQPAAPAPASEPPAVRR